MSDCSCPKVFNKSDYDGRELFWDSRTFYHIGMPMLYHIPVFYDFFSKRLYREIESSGLEQINDIVLLRDSAWIGELMVEVEGGDHPKIRDYDKTRVRAAVWEGPWHRLEPAIKQIKKEVKESDDSIEAMYFWYASCPACLEENGYRTVIFAILEPRVHAWVSEPRVKITEPVKDSS